MDRRVTDPIDHLLERHAVRVAAPVLSDVSTPQARLFLAVFLASDVRFSPHRSSFLKQSTTPHTRRRLMKYMLILTSNPTDEPRPPPRCKCATASGS
jgi:hypothetical protein